MKFSETTAELREERRDIIDHRWKQLYDLHTRAGMDAIKYVFLTNAGGAAATLAFIGAVGADKIGLGVKIALAFYVGGLFLLGFFQAAALVEVRTAFGRWKKLARKYLADESTYEEMMGLDIKNTEGNSWADLIPCASFVCFMVGSVFGFYALLVAS